jgi:hypothetical protein
MRLGDPRGGICRTSRLNDEEIVGLGCALLSGNACVSFARGFFHGLTFSAPISAVADRVVWWLSMRDSNNRDARVWPSAAVGIQTRSDPERSLKSLRALVG